jgi:hypothetical protein
VKLGFEKAMFRAGRVTVVGRNVSALLGSSQEDSKM